MKISLLFAWYDLWIGAYYDKKNHWLYILPVPMFGIILKLPKRRWFLFNNRGEVWDTTEMPHIWICKKKMYWAYNDDTKPIFKKDMKLYEQYFNVKFR